MKIDNKYNQRVKKYLYNIKNSELFFVVSYQKMPPKGTNNLDFPQSC